MVVDAVKAVGCRTITVVFQLADRNPKMGHGAIFWESREGNNKHFDSFLDKHPVSSLASSQSQVGKHYSFFYS